MSPYQFGFVGHSSCNAASKCELYYLKTLSVVAKNPYEVLLEETAFCFVVSFVVALNCVI